MLMSPWETICIKSQVPFSKNKNKTNIIRLHLLNLPRQRCVKSQHSIGLINSNKLFLNPLFFGDYKVLYCTHNIQFHDKIRKFP